MIILRSLDSMRAAVESARRDGRRIAVVPTMGFLHAGHLSLVDIARRNADVVVMSIFVNPAQFAPHEDLSRYPRDLPRDTALAENAGVDFLFLPDAGEIYPEGFDSFVEPGEAGKILEGALRPTHFRGVLTIVAKLFHLIQPHVAVFGQKDFQQALLIRRMVHDLNFGIEILVAPVVREVDGVAMSSRNVYLSPAERTQARALSAALQLASGVITAGERSAAALQKIISDRIAQEADAQIEYVAIADADTLHAIDALPANKKSVIALAVKIGKTRLLDNLII